MRRRDVIRLLGAAAVMPLPARAQLSGVPVIGVLGATSPDRNADFLRSFRHALKEAGYEEGETLAIEYRWADNDVKRLPGLAADLVGRRVAALAAIGNAATVAAKTATSTIPVVFQVGVDPVKLGLVASLARPGGNLTGINFFASEVAAKRMELLRELAPTATRVAVLVNPANPNAEAVARDVRAAAPAVGMDIQVHEAGTVGEIDAAFATFARERPDALFVAPDTFFRNRRVQLVLQATRHDIPATYSIRDYAEAGGLMSYGASLNDAMRQVGAYVGRILKGAKPADLPVVQAAKFELVINLQAARMLGLTVPTTLLARADEVIE